MAKFTVAFNTDNAAFEDDIAVEVATILRRIADRVEHHMMTGHYFTVHLHDTNGNKIGKYIYTK